MKTRIAMISEHASPLGCLGGADGGGQNVYVGQLALHLARLGYNVDVFTRKDDAALPAVIDWQDGVRIINVPAGPEAQVPKEDLLPFMDAFCDYMADHWDEFGGYDLVHANFWTSGVVAAGLKERLAVPFVITFHALSRVRRHYQGAADGFPDERDEIEEQLAHAADAVIAECPQDLEDLRTLYGVEEQKLRVVPCGFDPSELYPVAREAARCAVGVDDELPVLLSLGRLVPRKGVDNIVRALGCLRDEHAIAARLMIVGGESDLPDPCLTPEIGRLLGIARQCGVEDLVSFTGRKSHAELRYYYSAADVFITTPWYEPFGMTPLEAMACGTPVVGSAVGGIKHTVEHGVTGLVVEPNRPEELAESLARLLRNRGLAREMGVAGHRRATRLFQWSTIARAIADVFESLPLGDGLTRIEAGFDDVIEALQLSRYELAGGIARVGELIAETYQQGHKLLLCGNGGSAADAQHFAAELTGRYREPGRRALPALALTADIAFLTAWSNDVGFEDVFARQVEAFGEPGDLLIGISTSGRSKNVLAAFGAARQKGMRCLAIGGGTGGALRAHADETLIVPARDTQHIQEVHLVLFHLLCDEIEWRLFQPPSGSPRRGRLIPAKKVARAGRRETVAAA